MTKRSAWWSHEAHLCHGAREITGRYGIDFRNNGDWYASMRVSRYPR